MHEAFIGMGALACTALLGLILGTDASVASPTQQVQAPIAADFLEQVDIQVPIQMSEDEFIMAMTMWGEARSEGKTGMAYVGHVIMNRAAANFRGSTVREVSLWKQQFSCWNRRDPNRIKLNYAYLENSVGEERQRWEEAKELAYYITRGSADYTGGALHYHTTAINPKWSGDYQVTTTYKNHIFYR